MREREKYWQIGTHKSYDKWLTVVEVYKMMEEIQKEINQYAREHHLDLSQYKQEVIFKEAPFEFGGKKTIAIKYTKEEK